jgi:hypothetical protein
VLHDSGLAPAPDPAPDPAPVQGHGSTLVLRRVLPVLSTVDRKDRLVHMDLEGHMGTMVIMVILDRPDPLAELDPQGRLD